MVGGNIIDFHTKENVTHFLVQGTGCEAKDTVIVRAFLPENTIKHVKVNNSIWWQGNKVLLNVLSHQDVPFRKVSNSYGNAKVFYQEKMDSNN